ncbi:MAG: tRNA pseudouridine(54/55) synthase Pus10 [Candidatus Methanomethylophilus sp.]|nr:tRNA pseudouridine(54/55) synthase Pus10 [Methanomethylophilus sp.]MDD3232703.1 tRNA pseudouridine(54/55) synthase Pus10 [Methanomethylophilus sp.]MDD4221527.1 tRNA pseudouridine(54/55) synthase Pus10 [Methanomethylophilus sp.]MDD4668358.1 tRNA pseudouridine(54/55) synthase Pus10 [Methanomethylophilus sp.]
MTEEWVQECLEKAGAYAATGVCDHCLGRAFAKKGTGLTDLKRGQILRAAMKEQGTDLAPQSPCPLCEDIFDLVPRFAQAVAAKVDTVESDNFLVGCRIDPETLKREKAYWEQYGLTDTAEPLKTELNREVGKVALPTINRAVEFVEPQVVACVDTRFADVTLDLAPVFIAGRYNKLSREIPQTMWPCRVCHGKGCPRCHGTGKMYLTSVQEIIGEPALEMTKGKEHFFHGMGREDIDACMLGSGRPFILEISNPQVRRIDLDELEKQANDSVLAQFHGLHFVPHRMVAIYKGSDPDKTYRARVSTDDKVNKERVDEVALSFKNVHLAQRTPQRVAHRRADLVRDRMIYWVKAENVEEESFDLVMKTQSGTYVKEFVSGDEGRTTPNFSAALGIQCTVEALDVLEIDFQETED